LLQGLLRRSISVLAAAVVALALAPASASSAPVFAAGTTADLYVGIEGPATATARTQITYKLFLGDNGPDPSTGVMLTNTFSSPVTFNFAASASCTQTSPTVIVCGPSDLYVGGPASSFHLTVTSDTAGTLVNTVTGTENESDPNPSNNTASWSTTVTEPTTADLSISKGAPRGPIYVGQTFDYSIAFSNSGLADATNVTITDQLPAEVQFVSAEVPCSVSGNLVTCQFGTVAYHAPTPVFNIEVRALSAGSVTNTANISAEQPDPNPANNSSSVTVQIQPPTTDLAVTKTGTPNPVVAGQKETYTISVTNNGPSTATGVVAQDAWSAATEIKGGIAFKSVSTSQGTCTQSGAGISCNLGTLASGASATVTLVLQPRSKGTLSDTATTTGNEYDPNTANNSSTVLTTVG
jgi:uncharacterized repeat protein (TIGR01451 family)